MQNNDNKSVDLNDENKKELSERRMDSEKDKGIEIPLSFVISIIAVVISVVSIVKVNSVRDELNENIDKLNQTIIALQSNYEQSNTSFMENGSLEVSRTITNFEDYLRFLNNNKGYIALFAVRDIQGYRMTKDQADMLKALNFDQADMLLEHEYHSFIGIVQDGNAVYQQVGGDEKITYNTQIAGMNIEMESSTLNSGNKAKIIVNGVDKAINKRAFNIVLIDAENGNVVDSVEFDLHAKEMVCER